MFGKLNKHHVARGVNNAKNLIGQAYHGTRNMMGNVDSGVRAFKQFYGAVAPVLESYGVPTGNKQVMKALSGYDSIRGQVMDGHDRVMGDVSKLKKTLGGGGGGGGGGSKRVSFEFAS